MGRSEAIRGDHRRLRNAAAVCVKGRLAGVYYKRRLPNYAVFDEERWFGPGTGDLLAVSVAGVTVGVSICEDLWFPGGPVADSGAGGAELVVNVNASPYSIGRRLERLEVLERAGGRGGLSDRYVNQVGGQDELVFDGGSVGGRQPRVDMAEAVQFQRRFSLRTSRFPTSRGENRDRDHVPVVSP